MEVNCGLDSSRFGDSMTWSKSTGATALKKSVPWEAQGTLFGSFDLHHGL
ncbi:MAG: hypothetical protein ACI87E_000222 [Mariniblastus sp.]|jgi:hypothetical protein